MSAEIAIRVDEIVGKLLEAIEQWPEGAPVPAQLALRVDEIVGELREAIER